MYDIVMFPLHLTADGAFCLQLGTGEVLTNIKVLIAGKNEGEIPEGLQCWLVHWRLWSVVFMHTVGETRSYCFYLLLKDNGKGILRITEQWKNNVVDAFC